MYMDVRMYVHTSDLFWIRNCGTDSHSSFSVVITHIELEGVLLKYLVKSTEISLFLSVSLC